MLSPGARPTLPDMRLRDRIRRWWSPAKWRDEHPEISEGEGLPQDVEQRHAETVGKATSIKPADATIHGHRH